MNSIILNFQYAIIVFLLLIVQIAAVALFVGFKSSVSKSDNMFWRGLAYKCYKFKEEPKGWSEALNRRWTDYTMVKRRNYDVQSTTQNTLDWTTQTLLQKRGWTHKFYTIWIIKL